MEVPASALRKLHNTRERACKIPEGFFSPHNFYTYQDCIRTNTTLSMTIYILDSFKTLRKLILLPWISATNGTNSEMLWKKSPTSWVLIDK